MNANKKRQHQMWRPDVQADARERINVCVTTSRRESTRLTSKTEAAYREVEKFADEAFKS